MSGKLSFIILSWNSRRYLGRCFDSVIGKCSQEGIDFEIVAIDNGSSDGSEEVLHGYRQRYAAEFSVITLAANRGTTYPRNLGLKQARGDYLCILDSDTELEQGSLLAVMERLKSDNGIGILAPRLVLPDGTVQNSVKRFPTLLQKLLKMPQIFFGIQTRNLDFYEDFPFREERAADTAISACWFLRQDLVRRIGWLDEKIFYSPEDLDYCMRIWKRGYRIIFYPHFTVLHHTQQISHRSPFSVNSLHHSLGLLYYYSKHGGWFKSPSMARKA